MIDLLIILLVLIFVSYIDIKYKAIPSVILTGMIFVALLVRPENLYFGVASLVFALMIKDLIYGMAGMDFGVADVKVFVVMGLFISTLNGYIIMIILFLIYQFVYTFLWRWKVSKTDEMPFIPCLTAVYITLLLLGGVA
jgi:hypothetical protein